jgi:phosphoenolpyruvate phosphomutase
MSLKHLITPEERRRKLRYLLAVNGFARIIEAHNGLSGLIANEAYITLHDGSTREFDGLWESSLTDSASKGHPDAEIVSTDSRLHTIQEILNVTDKPMIVDGDTGGEATHFEYFCSKLERLGVSAVIIEDKVFPKRNSLEAGTKQDLESPEFFATKIARGKNVLLSDDFMIIARIESLIANKGVADAIYRARTYLVAGVDGIMIHSKQNDPREIFEFADAYKQLCAELRFTRPLVCVPTAYNTVTERELKRRGFTIVIHANHLLRAAAHAMEKTCRVILEYERSFEADPLCVPVKEIFERVGFLDVKTKDKVYGKIKTCAIIPAAGEPNAELRREFGEIPVSALKLINKSLIQRQTETLNSAGIFDVYIIAGYGAEKIQYANITKINNTDYDTTYILASLFNAEKNMNHGFILAYSDILFNEKLITGLLQSAQDIVLAIDSSYRYHKQTITKPGIELVITREHPDTHYRMLHPPVDNEIKMIGQAINKDLATHEFAGIAYFSERGAKILKDVYHDSQDKYKNCRFHESESFQMASFTDIVQEIIDRGFPVSALGVNAGWHEIQNKNDYVHALRSIR